MLLASHHAALDGAGAPEWVHLVPAGTFTGSDGRGPYRLTSPAAVIAASMAAGKLPIDENHSTDIAAPAGAPSPARAWIVAMESRADGLWGRVEWNPSGQQLMADHAYSGISPVFVHDKGGVVLRVLRAALTNRPNLPQLTSLHAELSSDERGQLPREMFAWPAKKELPLRDPEHVRLAWDMLPRAEGMTGAERREARSRILARARQLGIDTRDWNTAAHAASSGDDMDPTALRAALGLPETADDAAILAAVTAHAATAASHAQQVAAIAAAAGVAATTADGLVVALQAQRAGLGDVGQLAGQLIALQTEVQTLRASGARAAAIAFVDTSIKAGKPIVPLREHFIARHMIDAAAVEKEVGALPSINAGGITIAQQAQAVAEDEDPLTATDLQVARQMGHDPKAFAKHKRAMRLAREGSAA
jgi:hypothetical protein